MPVILANQETEISRFTFQSMARLKGMKWKLYHLLLPLVDPRAKCMLLIPLALCSAGLEVLGFFVCLF
jgi:hypothetical protein